MIRLRKQDREERDEHESLLDTYMHAIETASAPVARRYIRQSWCHVDSAPTPSRATATSTT